MHMKHPWCTNRENTHSNNFVFGDLDEKCWLRKAYSNGIQIAFADVFRLYLTKLWLF